MNNDTSLPPKPIDEDFVGLVARLHYLCGEVCGIAMANTPYNKEKHRRTTIAELHETLGRVGKFLNAKK